MKRKAQKALRTAVYYGALFIIALFAIPICLFLVPIMLIWKITDKILDRLE